MKRRFSIRTLHNDSWDNLNAVLSELTNADTRTAGLIRGKCSPAGHTTIMSKLPPRIKHLTK